MEKTSEEIIQNKVKSFIIEIEERNETVLMEVLRRFAVSVQPAKSDVGKKVK